MKYIKLFEEFNIKTDIKTWEGTDRSLEISLFENGLVAYQPKDRDFPDEWFVLYKISEDAYGTGWIRESELDKIIKGEEWASDEDVESFLSTNGSEKEEWLEMSFIQKMSDLLNYWGYENIMGSEYSPISKEEAEKLIEK